MNKIRLGFFIPEITNCGPINVVNEIIKNLNVSIFDIMLISLRKHNDTDNEYANKIIRKCSLGCIFLDGKNIADTIKNISSKLDIVHLHGLYPAKYSKFFKKNVKIIATVHNTFFRDYISAYGVIKGSIGALLHIYYLNSRVKYLIGCSDVVSNTIRKFTFHNKIIKTIHNGVDTNRFFPLSNECIRIQRKKLGFNEKDVLFVFSGALIRRKRVPELIQWFKENSQDDYKLIILGNGPELERCKSIASKNIIFLGSRSDPEKYYQISNFVISMSSAEGYPMSIIEAVSSGCYALFSNNNSHLEFIKYNGNATLICNFNIKLVEKRKINNKFLSSSIMACKYMEFYKSLPGN